MARRKNEKVRRSIQIAAYRSFVHKGFNATSYSDIARKSKQSRSLVQYYFPKKEDFIVSFLAEALDQIGEYALGLFDDSMTSLEKLYVGGQLYFAFLLADDSMRRFALEILSSRYATNQAIQVNGQWSFKQLAVPENKVEEYEKAHIISTGGVYELVYSGIEKGAALFPQELARVNIAIFCVFAYGYSYEESIQLLEGATLNQAVLETGTKKIISLLLDEVH